MLFTECELQSSIFLVIEIYRLHQLHLVLVNFDSCQFDLASRRHNGELRNA
jgi:hypothetical protein